MKNSIAHATQYKGRRMSRLILLRVSRYLRSGAFLLLLALLWARPYFVDEGGTLRVSIRSALADNVQYAYDALGRVIESVNNTTSQAVEYSYDATGNIAAIKTVSTNTLSIAGFSTTQAPTGTQITIYGTGFNPNAGANTVTINGVTATIVSATSTQLVVVVPSGTGKGPIVVNNSTSTTSSTTQFALIPIDDDLNIVVPIARAGAANTKFSVLANSNVPTISGFTPTVGAAGTSVTISGTNFQAAANDRVQFNQYQARVTSASSTSITTVVPPNTSSGKILVTTPYGTAVSSADFIIPPGSYSASNVAVSGRMTTDGTSSSLTLSTPSKIAVELFDGTAGQYFTLGISNDTIASATISVFDPEGNSLVSATVTPSTPAVQLPRLTESGTYSIVVDPGTNTGSLSLALVSPLTDVLTIGGGSKQYAISPAGRRILVSFSGTAGQYVTLQGNPSSISQGTLAIINPDTGAPLMSAALNGNSNTLQPQLPTGGTYSVLVDPAGAIGGNITLQLSATPTPVLNTSQSGGYSTSISNSSSPNLSFNGVAGQWLTLGVAETASASAGANLAVTDPTNTLLWTAWLSTTQDQNYCNPPQFICPQPGTYSGSVVLPMPPVRLPYSGTYYVSAAPTSGSGTLKVTLSSPVQGGLTVGGSSSTISTTAAGQGMLLSFSGSAGATLTLTVSESSTPISGAKLVAQTAAGTPVASLLFIPSADSYCTQARLGSTPYCTPTGNNSGSATMDIGPLPVTGTYSVLVQPTAAVTGSLTFGLMNVATGTITPGGNSVNLSTASSGQGMLLTFSGSAGQNLSLTVSENGTAIAGSSIVVFGRNGSQLGSLSFSPSANNGTYTGSATVNLSSLPATGTYSILVQQNYATDNGTLTFSLH